MAHTTRGPLCNVEITELYVMRSFKYDSKAYLWNTLPRHLRLCDNLGHDTDSSNGCERHFCLACKTTTPCNISLKCAA